MIAKARRPLLRFSYSRRHNSEESAVRQACARASLMTRRFQVLVQSCKRHLQSHARWHRSLSASPDGAIKCTASKIAPGHFLDSSTNFEGVNHVSHKFLTKQTACSGIGARAR